MPEVLSLLRPLIVVVADDDGDGDGCDGFPLILFLVSFLYSLVCVF